MTTPDGTPAPDEGLSMDSLVKVPLERLLEQIAERSGRTAADRVMDLHMDTVHPPINSRLVVVETKVDSVRMSIAKQAGILTATGCAGGGAVVALLKLFGAV